VQATVTEEHRTVSTGAQAPQQASRSAALPVTRDLMLAYALSLVVALVALVPAAGLAVGSVGLYGVDPKAAAGVAASAAGVLVPGFLADAVPHWASRGRGALSGHGQ
jgi:hypothetical protein